jgi:MYXO-CTERM domain-containing protein
MIFKTEAIAVLFTTVALAGGLAVAQPVALSVAPDPSLSCNGDADLVLAWQNMGATHFEAGDVTLLTGADLGGFSDTSPRTGNNNFSGSYGIPYTGPIPAGTVIGVYAEVGQRPPLASNTVQFFVLTNCSTRQVLFSCFGPYGTCPKTAQGVTSQAVPTTSRETMAALALLLAVVGAFLIRRRANARR